jgi:hypothetical protein
MSYTLSRGSYRNGFYPSFCHVYKIKRHLLINVNNFLTLLIYVYVFIFKIPSDHPCHFSMVGFIRDVLAVKFCKLFELDFQNLLVLLQVISNIYM